jgi:preprotein translocase subunit YajC
MASRPGGVKGAWHNPGLFDRPDAAMNLLDFLIAPAHAQAAAQQPGGFGMSLLFPILLIAVMYFLMIRPQMKRAKEHRAMLEKLARGDEVITNGGIAGTVAEIGENFVTVEIAANVRIRVQRGAIANVLPKGTLKSA